MTVRSWELGTAEYLAAMNACNPEDKQDGKCRGEIYYCQSVSRKAIVKFWRWRNEFCRDPSHVHPAPGTGSCQRKHCLTCEEKLDEAIAEFDRG